MSALVLLLLCQAPELSPPPLAPQVTPSPGAVAPAAEPPEVKLFAEFVERKLLAINVDNSGYTVRQKERVFRLQDDDFSEAFALVPEAQNAARIAHSDFVTGMGLQIAALVALGVSLGLTAVAPLLFSAILPMLVVGLVAAGAGLVLALVALPFLLSAQSKFFSSIASYNRGLLDLRPATPSAMSGGLSFVLPN